MKSQHTTEQLPRIMMILNHGSADPYRGWCVDSWTFITSGCDDMPSKVDITTESTSPPYLTTNSSTGDEISISMSGAVSIYSLCKSVGNYAEEQCEETPLHKFNCINGTPPYIPSSWVCDGERECVDGSDESETLCGKLDTWYASNLSQ